MVHYRNLVHTDGGVSCEFSRDKETWHKASLDSDGTFSKSGGASRYTPHIAGLLRDFAAGKVAETFGYLAWM
ncbi:hypothetical protein AAK967_02245 [Atopobiaceae bacterium 24-176]